MSPRNQVDILSLLCLKTIAQQVIHLLADDEGKYYNVVRKFLQDATFHVLQDLLGLILKMQNLDASTRFSCLEVLLRSDVKKLETGIFPHSYYKKILEVIRGSGGGLQHLNLKGVWVRDFPELFSSTLRELKYLKTLTIPHMADDSVIETIMECKNLTVLDISGESAFTVSGLRKIQSDTLTVLSIGNFGKKDVCTQEDSSFDVVANLIANLPNLTVLRTYSYTGKSLLNLYKKNKNFQSKLKYLHDTNTTFEEFDAIVNTCPLLENIYLNTPNNGLITNLGKLKKLHSLKLSRFLWTELHSYLQLHGSRLQTLKLNTCKEEIIDLSVISHTTPNLITLECFKVELNFTDLNSYFMSLENLEVLYCNINGLVLGYLLLNSPYLKKVVVGDVIHMTDGDIFRLCAECDFANLEQLWFTHARYLTATSVELLMGHCPNLKVLGQLSGWDVSSSEVEILRAVITASNTNLTLQPTSTE